MKFQVILTPDVRLAKVGDVLSVKRVAELLEMNVEVLKQRSRWAAVVEMFDFRFAVVDEDEE
jgi:hypothetical protein